jgi:O-antigen/teichoic acid export membrane protein
LQRSPAQPSRSSRYLAGLATGYLVTFTNLAIAIWLTPFTLQFLSTQAYAIFSLGANVIMLLTLIDIGIAAGVNAHLSQRVGQISADEISQYASSGFFVQLAIVGIVALVGAILALGFPNFFDVPPDLAQQSIIMIAILVIGTALSLAIKPFSSILIAHQLLYVDNLIRLCLLVVRTILTVIFLNNGLGLLSLALANLIATAITALLAVLRAFRAVPRLRISPRRVSWAIIKTSGGTGIWFTLGGIAGLIIQSIDSIVAGKVVALEAVTTLTITARVYALSQGLLYQITDVARPALAQLIGQGKRERALLTYRQLFALSSGLAAVACAALWTVNETFISRWVGAGLYGGALLDTALALNLLINVWVLPNRAILSANLEIRPQVISRLIEAALNIGLSIWLATQFGLVGVVVSTALAALITSLFYLPYLTARMFERPFWRFLLDDARPILVLLLLLMLIAFIMRRLVAQIGGYEGTLLGLVVVGAVGALLLWFLVLDNDVRGRIAALVMTRLRRES